MASEVIFQAGIYPRCDGKSAVGWSAINVRDILPHNDSSEHEFMQNGFK
ncbi:hypothetical protein GCM10008018_37850 [Paenibacillus marchantiophytorum]|uniref:Uncharacterized protein n=1 Tax=Paenibacillus marchantiophytorum TaxID=1619310 RepID=A0ABQ1EV57_9BACL|nr:hypothetical protein GCM10008018_37850 [Paenibacillus marchantiophytorum]